MPPTSLPRKGVNKLNTEPTLDEIKPEDESFASAISHWAHAADQLGCDPMHVRATLSLAAVTLRSANKRERRDLLGFLGIKMGSGENNVDYLMAHAHDEFERITEEVPDELQSWKTRCTECGEERRVLRG